MKSNVVTLSLVTCLIVCPWVLLSYAAENPAGVGADQAGASVPSDSARLRASCQNNLKQMGIIFKMFANEAKGQVWPCLSPKSGTLFVANESEGISNVYPEYLTDVSVLLCPADKDAEKLKETAKSSDPRLLFDDQSYIYLGYAISNQDDLAAFAQAYKDIVAKGEEFDRDLTLPGGKTLYRLREGVERFFITDINDAGQSAKIQSTIPVLIERPGNHKPDGGNVLYMDGHVEFIRYADDGTWPMTKAAMETLKHLEETKPLERP